MPVLLEDGLRFFEHLNSSQIKLEKLNVMAMPGGGTHINFRVVK